MRKLRCFSALYPLLAFVPLVALLSLACHDVHLDYSHEPGEIVLHDDLYSVSVVDAQNVVAVGYYGSAYFTRDGGEHWRQGQTGTLASLYEVSMADAQHGWAVGQRGLILRTDDGGETWQRQPNTKEKEGTHLFGVSAIDANTAWAIGEWGTRIRTRDGGKTWEDHSFTVDEEHPMFVWLSPVDQDKVRNGERVYEDVGLNDIHCLGAPSLKCWLIGEFGYIYYTEDGGESWQTSSIEGSVEIEPVRVGYNEVDISDASVASLKEFAASIRDEGHLNVAIEAVASRAEIAAFGKKDDPSELFEILEARAGEVRTALEDAGLPSERVRMRGQPPWDYEDYLAKDPEFLNRYLAGRLHANPGVKVRVIQNPILFTVRFRDESNGLIAGLGGVILRSRDGGRSWAYRKTDRTQALFSVGSVEGRALAIGEKGLIRVSTDDGESWTPPAKGTFPNIFTYLRDIGFEAGGQVGYIVGQTGQVLRSQDAGYEWKQVLPPLEKPAEGA